MNTWTFWTIAVAIVSLDKISIVHSEDSPLLWYATSQSIKTTEIGSYLSKTVIGGRNWIESFSLYEDYIYWIDTIFNKYGRDTYEIMRAKQDGSKIETIISSDSLKQPKSIAVDPETGDIYYGDSGCKTINVCANDGTNCRILYDIYVETPVALVLHPQKRKIFWANRSDITMIVAASMDGTSARPIVVKNMYWPTGLDIDFSSDRLYWSVSIDDSISNCNLDGTDRRTSGTIRLGVFAVAILHDRIYHARTHINVIVSIDKTTGRDEEPVIGSEKVYHIRFPWKK